MEQKTRLYIFFLRFMAGVLVMVAAIMIAMPPEAFAHNPRLGAWTGLLISISAAVALLSLAWMVSNHSQPNPESRAAYSRLEQQLTQLNVRLHDLAVMYDRGSRTQNFTTMIPPKDYSKQIDQLTAAVADVRELTLLSPKQRNERLKADYLRRKDHRAKEVLAMIDARDWPAAERSVSALESEHPGDDEIQSLRVKLNNARQAVEEESVVAAICEIEGLVQTSKWEDARRKSELLIEGFPTSGDARVLKQRVEHEYQYYRETTVRAMIKDIRAEAERKNWQSALDCAQELIAFYPEHHLVEAISRQISTLQANLEIEQRQAIEIRLYSLVQDGQTEEAIELAEDTIRRYPNSPQAESFEKLLPRLREMGTEGVNEFSGFGQAPNPFTSQSVIDHETLKQSDYI